MFRIAVIVAATLAGCSTPRPAGRPLVDPRQAPARPGLEPGAWEYRREARADLDDDGVDELVVLLANVAVDQEMGPIWDDGQVWEVRVEESTGEATRIYARFIQLGQLRADVVSTAAGLAVLLLEETPFGISVYEVDYRGPGDVRVRTLAERTVAELLAPAE